MLLSSVTPSRPDSGGGGGGGAGPGGHRTPPPPRQLYINVDLFLISFRLGGLRSMKVASFWGGGGGEGGARGSRNLGGSSTSFK